MKEESREKKLCNIHDSLIEIDKVTINSKIQQKRKPSTINNCPILKFLITNLKQFPQSLENFLKFFYYILWIRRAYLANLCGPQICSIYFQWAPAQNVIGAVRRSTSWFYTFVKIFEIYIFRYILYQCTFW